MNTQQDDGCYKLDAVVNGKPELGVYCICSSPLCNEGSVPDVWVGEVAWDLP